MRRIPQLLAFSLILITFFRVSSFLAYGIRLGVLGYAFATALTLGVYVAGFYTNYKETMQIAWGLLLLFGITDLYFNELEMVRTLAPEQLISVHATFLGNSADGLQRWMEIAAVAYGALPTLMAAGLGILQARAYKVAALRYRGMKIPWAVGIMGKIQSYFPETLETSGQQRKLPTVANDVSHQLPADVENAEIVATHKRWSGLTQAEKDQIANLTTRQVMAIFGQTRKTASNWKNWVEKGK